MSEIPVIRIELERMKTTLYAMLAKELAEMDQDVKASVEAFCTPKNIRAILDQHVEEAINSAIRTELGAFFNHGEGRKIIRKAIEERFADNGNDQ